MFAGRKFNPNICDESVVRDYNGAPDFYGESTQDNCYERIIFVAVNPFASQSLSDYEIKGICNKLNNPEFSRGCVLKFGEDWWAR